MNANDESKRLKESKNGSSSALIQQSRYVKYSALWVIGAVCLQLFAGLLNLLLLAPTWMQLLHLLLADLVWIGFVILAANTFSKSNVSADVNVDESVGIPKIAHAAQPVNHPPIVTS